MEDEENNVGEQGDDGAPFGLERKLATWGDVTGAGAGSGEKPDVEGRTVRGYASVFGVLDSHGDIVMPGAFTLSIKERMPRIRYLLQHDQKAPLAVPSVLVEDAKGLYFEATLPSGARQDQALEDIKNGLITGVSIGFFTRAFETFEDERLRAQLHGWARYAEMRRLTELELVEFSSVTFPSNPEAEVIDVRDARGGCRKRLVHSIAPGAPAPTKNTSEDSALEEARAIAQALREARLQAELRSIVNTLNLT